MCCNGQRIHSVCVIQQRIDDELWQSVMIGLQTFIQRFVVISLSEYLPPFDGIQARVSSRYYGLSLCGMFSRLPSQFRRALSVTAMPSQQSRGWLARATVMLALVPPP